MKVITAKVLATGKEIVAVEKSDDANVFVDQFGGREYKADELEIKNEREVPDGSPVGGMLPFPFPEHDPFNPQDIIEKMLTMQQGNFWRDQRVEITKILLKTANPFADLLPLVEKADEIIQKLKSYGE